MADKVKELYRGTVTLQQIQESTDGTVELYTTDDKTQHVIKDIQFNSTTFAESYITNNGFVECKVGIPASGSSIVDKNSTISLKSTKSTFLEYQITFAVGSNIETKLITQKLISDGFIKGGFRKISSNSKTIPYIPTLSLTNRFAIKGTSAFVNSNFTGANTSGGISIWDITKTDSKIDMFHTGANAYAAFSPYKNTIYYKPDNSKATISALDIESAPPVYNIGSEQIIRIVFGDNGKYIYTLDHSNANGKITRRTLKTPWNLEEISETTITNFSTLGGTTISYTAFQFNSDGTKVYGLNNTTKAIQEITLTTAWDLSSGTRTVVSNRTFSNAVDFYMHTDGSFIIVKSTSENSLRKYPLTTPFDITTIGAFTESYIHTSLHGTGQFAVSSDGNYIIYVGEYTSGWEQWSTIKIKLNIGNFSLTSCSLQETLPHHSSGSYVSAPSNDVIAFKGQLYNTPIALSPLGANGAKLYWNFQDNTGKSYLITYKIDSTFGISNYKLCAQVVKSITLNDNTVTPLPNATLNQRLYAEGKYLFYSQNNGDNIYVIDTDTWNVGLLTNVGLTATMGTTHSFSVHYNLNTDEYCLLTFASGKSNKAVCYVSTSVIESVCSNRNSYNCTWLEKYNNDHEYSQTTASVTIPPVLVDKYFLILPTNNINTYRNIPAVYDIRAGVNTTSETFNFLEESLSAGSNIMFVAIDTLPTPPDSANYALYNKDIGIRISGIEITGEN